jgi:glutathione peroxidase
MKAFLIFLFGLTFISLQAQNNLHEFTMTDIFGEDVNLSDYEGKVVMVVNTASKCGLTDQYAELQALYEERKDEDFVILGFPANNFMGQEPGSDDEIIAFCEKNYGVTFPMFSKISVKGYDQADLYAWLTKKERNGVMDAPVTWNFQKFLIDKDGNWRISFSPKTKVTEKEVQIAIDELLTE